jgi:hypothetical protein
MVGRDYRLCNSVPFLIEIEVIKIEGVVEGRVRKTCDIVEIVRWRGSRDMVRKGRR